MVGDMFNHSLKAKVDGLCSELSQILAMQPFAPFAAGFQSQRQGGGRQEGRPRRLRYRFGQPIRTKRRPAQRRRVNVASDEFATALARRTKSAMRISTKSVDYGHVTVHDTLDHQISGVSQQQGRGGLCYPHQPAWDSYCLNSAGRLVMAETKTRNHGGAG